MNITFTQEEMEKVLPVAVQKNDKLFEALLPEMERQVQAFEADYFATGGVERFDAAVDSLTVRGDVYALRSLRLWIYLTVFRRMMRSLDVVLTGTGFGVVSTQDLAPASQQRVDAVMQETKHAEYLAFDNVILIFSDANFRDCFDREKVAARFGTLFPFYGYISRYTSLPFTPDTWDTCQPLLTAAHTYLYGLTGRAFVDYYINNVSPSALPLMKDMLLKVIGAYVSGDTVRLNRQRERLLRELQPDVAAASVPSEAYELYVGSKEYQARTAANYENKKESSAFFFG